MIETGKIRAIDARYTKLADSGCCLSCGGAVNHSAVQPGEICLDLGSGRGNDVIRMAGETGPEGKVYGIDISDGMLRKARSTAERLGVTNVEFLQGELEALPLETGTVDLVISNCVLNHAEDKGRVWKEIFRVMKKGGRFVISDIYSSAPVPEEYRNDPEAVAECWAGSVTRETYLKQVTEAGFQQVQILEESAPYPKGKIEVSSWTITGFKPAGCCCC